MSAGEQKIRGAFSDALELLETSRSVTSFAKKLVKVVVDERREQKENGTKRKYNGNFVGFKEVV